MLQTNSSFKMYPTHYLHRRTLVKAIKLMGYKVLYKATVKTYDIFGQDEKVDICVDVGSPYMIGFKRGYNRYYKVIADWEAIERTVTINHIRFLNNLEKLYFRLLDSSKYKFLNFLEEVLLAKLLYPFKKLALSSKRLYIKLKAKRYKRKFSENNLRN
ncbi:MAG: DUF1257 domain-containing protein, partial [Spirochaetota bacterium]|nr:DUF1257 domain-containing protein [Spirochaetota bacterium]